MADAFVLVDKPAGWTSHDVVAKLRHLFGIKRIGHAGTLDPMATGLLVVGLGKATRLLRFIQELPKTYEATLLFGAATDSGDADGDVIATAPVDFSDEQLAAAAIGFEGTIDQVPPQVSAIKVGGERLHELARRGEQVQLRARQVRIHSIAVEAVALPRAKLLVTCGKGTYIRVLADDIASSLGSRAHLTALRRTASGSLLVEDAAGIEELEIDPQRHLLSPAVAMRDFPAVAVPTTQATAVRHGAAIEGVAAGADLVVALDGGELVGVYRRDRDRLLPEVVVA